MKTRGMWVLRAGLLFLAFAVAGCASGPQAVAYDPFEPFNRRVDHFNDTLDRAALKPVASTYQAWVPAPVRTGVSNVFNNLRDAWSALNAALQARPREAAENLMRFGVNTTLGLGGVLDIASEAGIPRTTLDFGHTLGRWGVPAGPYVVLPFLGPSSVRDSAGLLVDSQGDAVTQVPDHVPSRNSLSVLRVVDMRVGLLRAGDLIDGVALDRYSFMRDAYLQRRQSQIGAATEERFDQD